MSTAALRILHRRKTTYLIAAAVTAVLLAAFVITTTISAHAAVTLISQGKTATASSTENAGTPASAAVDGNLTGTRWSSAFSDPQWIQIDLGATASISQVVLTWEAAYATAFQVQTSADGSNWANIYSTTTGAGGTQTLNVTGSGRYIRVYGTVRKTGYGYSLYEFQVYGDFGTTTPACGTANAAQGRTATASSVENAGTPASAAVDGNGGTRWSSAASDPQWLQVDLGSSQSICQVQLNWEAAYGKSFQVQVSANGTSGWTDIYATTTGTGGNQTLNVAGTGRYIRVYGTVRATGYGYSLWEFIVHTGTGPTASATASVTPSTSVSTSSPSCSGGSTVTGGGALGPNVIVFDPSMSGAAIQTSVNNVFAQMESNQFGTQRYQLLFKPGVYNNYFNAQIGFYTSISGLGQNPDDVQLHGDVTVDAGWFGGNATQNFWRSAENYSIYPSRRGLPVGGGAGRAVPSHRRPRWPDAGAQRLRLGLRRLHRRLPGLRHRQHHLAAAVVHP